MCRINLYSGPGAGKSTTAAWLFSELKKADVSVELVSEYVKAWAIANRPVVGFDQIYLMGKQLNYEYRFLANGIKNVVTDSPVLLSACYTRFYFNDLGVAEPMEEIICKYEEKHPSLNIFLNRGDKPYRQEGRYQSAAQAQEMDLVVRDTLDRLKIPYQEFSFFDNQGILDHVLKNVSK